MPGSKPAYFTRALGNHGSLLISTAVGRHARHAEETSWLRASVAVLGTLSKGFTMCILPAVPSRQFTQNLCNSYKSYGLAKLCNNLICWIG